MSYLLTCLLLAPVSADAGWSPSAAYGERPLTASPPAAAAAASVPSAAGGAQHARLLPPPGTASNTVSSPVRAPSRSGVLTSVFGSLVVVLAAFFVVAWVTQRTAPRRLAPLPPEVLECLGRAPLTARQQVQLLRLGRKLLLVSVTATDARILSEVTDPLEVDRLAALCQQNRPESITASFRQVLAQCAGDQPARGVYGASPGTPPRSGAADRAETRERRA